MDEQERRRFDKHIDYVRSEWGTIEDARQEGLAKGREEGLEEGLAKGREEGREEGLEEGFAKGCEEERKRHERGRKILVKSLHDNGIAIEIIAESVGLSEPAIRRLLDDE